MSINGINRSSPLTRGLRVALSGKRFVDEVSGLVLPEDGIDLVANSTGGIVYDNDADGPSVNLAGVHSFAGATAWSISFWLDNYDDVTGYSIFQGNGATANSAWGVHVLSTDVRFYHSDGTVAAALNSGLDPSGGPHHFVLTWDKDENSGKLTAYKNGGTGVDSSTGKTSAINASPGSEYQLFQLGAYTTLGIVGSQWNVLVWDRKLTATEARLLYAPQTRWSMYNHGTRTYFIPGAAAAGDVVWTRSKKLHGPQVP